MLTLHSIALFVLAENTRGFGETEEERVALNEIYHLYETQFVLGRLYTKIREKWVNFDSRTRERRVWDPRTERCSSPGDEAGAVAEGAGEKERKRLNSRRKKCLKGHKGVLREKGLLEASDYARDRPGSIYKQPTIVQGIPFRCVFNTFDQKATMAEPTSYWSGNVTTVRTLLPGNGKIVSPTIAAIAGTEVVDDGEGDEEIHTLEYWHCRPGDFPGWSNEGYHAKLRELYELSSQTFPHQRMIMNDLTDYLESSPSSSRYFHRCHDGTLKEYNPSTLTTRIYEPFKCQATNAEELEEWYQELHETKRAEKRKRGEERSREYRRRKVQRVKGSLEEEAARGGRGGK
ncbi:uncharacterized protein JCM6883_005709 [Sporobolomyces salmoneus]|uniref:uncharacterized protein n=1 Tax=Sporobolomyces salmoneus TaxID=183962 RepID=UPI0031726254